MSARLFPNLFSSILLLLALTSSQVPHANAQSEERIRATWKGPDLALIRSILKEGGPRAPAAGAATARPEVLKFTPAGDSGVAAALAGAFGRADTEKAALKQAFEQIKQGYEAEVAKEGKSYNLAAAMTFFIAANVSAYHRTDMPSDEAGETLFKSLAEAMAASPIFAGMSNAEKQQMYDWLVCMAGFVATGYADAKQNNDQEGLKNFGELADYAMRLALGVEVGKMSFAGNKLSVAGGASAPPTGSSTDQRIVGAWSISASSPVGSPGTIDATQKLMVNAGYYKGQYQFKPDGTYTFKSERWYGYMRSKEFYTTEESGTYALNGDALTVSPKTSRTILRNPEGVVQRAQNNPLERVTYRWQLHHFEGINETQLILRPPSETTRDGGFSQTSLFPNSYLYSPGGNLEWKF